DGPPPSWHETATPAWLPAAILSLIRKDFFVEQCRREGGLRGNFSWHNWLVIAFFFLWVFFFLGCKLQPLGCHDARQASEDCQSDPRAGHSGVPGHYPLSGA